MIFSIFWPFGKVKPIVVLTNAHPMRIVESKVLNLSDTRAMIELDCDASDEFVVLESSQVLDASDRFKPWNFSAHGPTVELVIDSLKNPSSLDSFFMLFLGFIWLTTGIPHYTRWVEIIHKGQTNDQFLIRLRENMIKNLSPEYLDEICKPEHLGRFFEMSRSSAYQNLYQLYLNREL